MILGDLGAEILKIERPGVGDDTRNWGPPWVGNESAYFLSINRNKKSLTVDLKSQQGTDIIKKLLGKCDVFIENYVPGKLDKMGLGYAQLSQNFPELIYCSISGYGQDGPYKERSGYDVIAAGMGGLMHITGPEEGEPCRVGVAMTDLSTGLYAYGAIMAAILHRQKSGRGQHIDCNLLSTQVATLTHIGSNYLNANIEARRYGNGHASIVPYQAFKTSDSYILVGCGNDHLFHELCEAMAMPQLKDDSRYLDNGKRVENRKTLIKSLSDRYLERTTSEWLGIFENCSFPYGPINNMNEVFSNEQVINNDMIQEMDHHTEGRIRVPGPAVRYSESNTVLQYPPPTLGRHTEEVLQELLGYTQGHLHELRRDKVI